MEAIKPRQIINYDAGIILIDLHQLNVKTTSDNTTSDTEYVKSYVNEEQNLQNNNLQHPLPNQMIEQINIALEQKRVREFQPLAIEACRRRLTSGSRAYTSIKSDEE